MTIFYAIAIGKPQTADFANISASEIEELYKNWQYSDRINDIGQELFDYEQFKTDYSYVFECLKSEVIEKILNLICYRFELHAGVETEREYEKLIKRWLPLHCQSWYMDNVLGAALFTNWCFSSPKIEKDRLKTSCL